MRPLKILLVTDNVSVGLVAARYLNAQGFAVSTAPNVELAIAKLTESATDIVVLDELGAPDRCIDALRLMRRSPGGRAVPVLLGLESSWDRALREVAEGDGEVMFIDQPFTKMARLLEYIRRILAIQAVADAADDAFDGVFQEWDKEGSSESSLGGPDLGSEFIQAQPAPEGDQPHEGADLGADLGADPGADPGTHQSFFQEGELDSLMGDEEALSGSHQNVPWDDQPSAPDAEPASPPLAAPQEERVTTGRTGEARPEPGPTEAAPGPEPQAAPGPEPQAAPGPEPQAAPGPDEVIFSGKHDDPGPDLWAFMPREVRAKGSLQEFPIAELLCRCFAEQYDGVLIVTRGHVNKRLFLRGGKPVYVESDQDDERFGAFLLRLGRLTPEQFAMLKDETARTGRKQGELLLEQGLISPHELYQLLVDQVTEKILNCFVWLDGIYQFLPGQSLDPSVVPFRLEFARLLLDGVGRHYDERRLAPYFPDWPQMKVVPWLQERLQLEQLLLTTTEARLWDLAERGSAVGELERHAAGGPVEARGLLAGLLLLEWLAFERIKVVAAPRVQPPPVIQIQRRRGPVPAPSPSYVITVQERELLEELDRLDGVDHFGLLGVTQEDAASRIHDAFRTRAKQYHPDKLVRYSLIAQRRGAEHYRRLVAAYQVLADNRQREAYLAVLRGESPDESSSSRSGPGAGGPAMPGQTPFPVMSREALMKAVRQWLVAKDYDRAVTRLGEVRKVEPDDAQYKAWHGWAMILQSPDKNRREGEKLLSEARKAAPDHPDPLFLIGRLCESEGAYAKALDFYVKASAQNPYDVDLAREVRLLEMRLRKGVVKKREPKKRDAPAAADEDKGVLDQDVGAIFRKVFGKK